MARRSRPIVNVARGVLRSVQYSSRSRGRQVSGSKIFTALRLASRRHGNDAVNAVGNRSQGREPGGMKAGTEWDETGNWVGC